jgi:hypothetical protein
VTGALHHARVGPASVWCSARAHGNVGDHVGDDPAVVAANRRALARACGLGDPGVWVWLRQVHGAGVHTAGGPPPEPPEADAAVTTRRGLVLAVVTADCAPVVLACDGAVAVAHAGHRGLAAGVIGATVERLRAAGRGEVHAYLGPCIRPAHYEFGHADLDRLVARFGPAVAATTPQGAPAFDIPKAVGIALARAGVEHFEDSGLCTASGDFFSYRRDGATGRQATVAVLP